MSRVSAKAEWIEGLRRRIDRALEGALVGEGPGETLRAARYATQGGRRWRGLLAVAAGGIFRADAGERAMPLAVALEMMQAASLVLDDLPSMDHASTRRGRACAHLVFPRWVVDLLPAFLVNRAHQVVAEAPGVSEGCRIRALRLLGEMGTRMARGQEMDLALGRSPIREDELMECYALKSGALFAAALGGGAVLCGAGEGDAAALGEVGTRLGQAYQILDDIADGPEEDAGRGVGRATAYHLFGAVAARERAERLLAEAEGGLDRFGPAAERVRELLGRIRG